MHGEVLNVLRWTTAAGDARQTIPPQKVQPTLPFLGHRPPVITRAEFARTGFTQAHLDGVRFTGYRMAVVAGDGDRALDPQRPSRSCTRYYDGVDKVSHEYGLGVHYDAEVAAADRLVGDVLDAAAPGTAVVVVSDHGQVEVGDNVVPLAPDVIAHVSLQSGEGRFRWLHARPGHGRRAGRSDRSPRTATPRGSVPATRWSTRDGSARTSAPTPSPGSVTWPSWPVTTSRSSSRPTPARST